MQHRSSSTVFFTLQQRPQSRAMTELPLEQQSSTHRTARSLHHARLWRAAERSRTNQRSCRPASTTQSSPRAIPCRLRTQQGTLTNRHALSTSTGECAHRRGATHIGKCHHNPPEEMRPSITMGTGVDSQKPLVHHGRADARCAPERRRCRHQYVHRQEPRNPHQARNLSMWLTSGGPACAGQSQASGDSTASRRAVVGHATFAGTSRQVQLVGANGVMREQSANAAGNKSTASSGTSSRLIGSAYLGASIACSAASSSSSSAMDRSGVWVRGGRGKHQDGAGDARRK